MAQRRGQLPADGVDQRPNGTAAGPDAGDGARRAEVLGDIERQRQGAFALGCGDIPLHRRRERAAKGLRAPAGGNPGGRSDPGVEAGRRLERRRALWQPRLQPAQG